jgi:hypothetical protein
MSSSVSNVNMFLRRLEQSMPITYETLAFAGEERALRHLYTKFERMDDVFHPNRVTFDGILGDMERKVQGYREGTRNGEQLQLCWRAVHNVELLELIHFVEHDKSILHVLLAYAERQPPAGISDLSKIRWYQKQMVRDYYKKAFRRFRRIKYWKRLPKGHKLVKRMILLNIPLTVVSYNLVKQALRRCIEHPDVCVITNPDLQNRLVANCIDYAGFANVDRIRQFGRFMELDLLELLHYTSSKVNLFDGLMHKNDQVFEKTTADSIRNTLLRRITAFRKIILCKYDKDTYAHFTTRFYEYQDPSFDEGVDGQHEVTTTNAILQRPCDYLDKYVLSWNSDSDSDSDSDSSDSSDSM